MKFRVTMKTPDALDDAIDEALCGVRDEDARWEWAEEFRDLCRRWFRCAEALTVEVDTEVGTCVVVETRS